MGEYEPVRDAQQDWELLSAREDGNYTVLRMRRNLVTGDADDLCIMVRATPPRGRALTDE